MRNEERKAATAAGATKLQEVDAMFDSISHQINDTLIRARGLRTTLLGPWDEDDEVERPQGPDSGAFNGILGRLSSLYSRLQVLDTHLVILNSRVGDYDPDPVEEDDGPRPRPVPRPGPINEGAGQL